LTDREDVIAIEEYWPQALQDRDGKWLRQHTTAGFIFIGPDGTITEREAYLSHREHENDEVVEGGNKVDHVEVLGDVAVVVGRSQFIARDRSGQEYPLRFRYSGVYLRSDGTWRAATGHLTSFSGTDEQWGQDLLSRRT
jgi:ketosteroid isomerase-like protein